jgi:hypothetical protein
MKTGRRKTSAAARAILGAGIVAGVFLVLAGASNGVRAAGAAGGTAPFIVQDTDTDSPGTNIVTRIVTITAKVAGTPPVARQWKVDHGRGFVTIPGATNATFRIGNAQVSDSGLYSLFATNSFGGTNTTPVPLIVIEGVD